MYSYSHLSELSHIWNDIVMEVMKNIFYTTNLRICDIGKSDWFPLGNMFFIKYVVKFGVNCSSIRLYYPAVIFSSLPDTIRAQ